MGKGDKTDFAWMDPRREGNQEKGTGENTHSGRHELSGKNKSGKVGADEHGIFFKSICQPINDKHHTLV